jgi:hypothetical protein
MAAEVEALKARLSDPRLDTTRGREYMVRVGVVGGVGGVSLGRSLSCAGATARGATVS